MPLLNQFIPHKSVQNNSEKTSLYLDFSAKNCGIVLNMLLIKLLIISVSIICSTNGARLLGIFPISGMSHYILASKLMKGLTNAGHDVTFVSPYETKFKPENGSFRDVFLDGISKKIYETAPQIKLFELDKGGIFDKLKMMKAFTSFFSTLSELTLKHPKMKELVESKTKYDAVIMEQFQNNVFNVYAHLFDCPLILLSAMGATAMVNPTVGNPQPISYVPHYYLGTVTSQLSFKQRALNLFYHILTDRIEHLISLPAQDKLVHEIYPDAPSLYDLYTNVSLVLLSSHTSTNAAVPIVPNMVEIGGYFIDPPKKLPQDLQEFMDNATEGVIYFSMGSNLQSKDMTPERKQIFLNIFRKLKQKVIWKFEEDLERKPENVLIQKWCPQQDILAHPNVKLFITHGGLLSTTETTYHGVPILAIPVFGDQPLNAAKAEDAGYARVLNYHDPEFSEEKLHSLLNELLNNPKFRENAKMRQKIFHDRPNKPLETMVYWVEYVIRHKGAPHLRVAGIKFPWYKYFLVDVLSVVFVIIAIIGSLLVFSTKKIICKVYNSSKENKHKSE